MHIVVRVTVLEGLQYHHSDQIVDVLNAFTLNTAISKNANVSTESGPSANYGGTRYIRKNSYVDLVYKEDESHFFKALLDSVSPYTINHFLSCTLLAAVHNSI